ncbi:MAG: putative bifunctional diguanylate cyclase/phosphodiesterase, partial [Rubrimonas sp.]
RMAAGDEGVRVPDAAIAGAATEIAALGRSFNQMAERIALGRERMAAVARRDGLTGLLNRDGFFSAAQPLLAEAADAGAAYALFFIDVDQFKAINDSFGHAAGDELLREVARRLRKTAGPESLIARQGGDEFLILTPKTRRKVCALMGGRLLAALRKPFHIGDRKLALSVSVGVSSYPRDAQDIDGLVLRADQAMYQAKERGRNALRFFDADIQRQLDEDTTLIRELRAAVEQGAVTARFQPIVSARTGVITGFEALARWRSPTLGAVGAERFIALAEQTGLILPLGLQIREQACQFAAALRRAGTALPVSVNVTQQELAEPNFAQQLLDSLAAYGLPPSAIQLEITESLFQHQGQEQLDALFALKDRGVRFALDDFGKGYSSHSRLRTYPIDRLKIAVDFVGDVMTDPGARAVVRSLIDLGRRLRLHVTVEGVETAAQRDLVATLGADDIQGFWHHPPLAADAALALAVRMQRMAAALAG